MTSIHSIIHNFCTNIENKIQNQSYVDTEYIMDKLRLLKESIVLYNSISTNMAAEEENTTLLNIDELLDIEHIATVDDEVPVDNVDVVEEINLDHFFSELSTNPCIRRVTNCSNDKLNSFTKEICSICLETPRFKDAYVTTCNHIFCKPCFNTWEKSRIWTKVYCPYCKMDNPTLHMYGPKKQNGPHPPLVST